MRYLISLSTVIIFGHLGLAGCAGYRGGWESLPYIDEPPPSPARYRTPFEAMKRSELVLPGLTLSVSINNQLRTYETEVYLYVLPLSVDTRDVPTQNVDPGKTRVTLRISHHDGDIVFRPRLARLGIGDEWVSGDGGFEFGMWDQSATRVRSGGVWGYRPTEDSLVLTKRDAAYVLSIDFLVPVPAPESRAIALDLSQALQAPGRPAIPLIRFLPVRWKEGYT